MVLGYLDPANFLGGRMPLDARRRRGAIRAAIAEPMGLDVVEAAAGINQVVNENMVAATRIHVAERGARRAPHVPDGFGGAGPVHADAIARALGCAGTSFPRAPGSPRRSAS